MVLKVILQLCLTFVLDLLLPLNLSSLALTQSLLLVSNLTILSLRNILPSLLRSYPFFINFSLSTSPSLLPLLPFPFPSSIPFPFHFPFPLFLPFPSLPFPFHSHKGIILFPFLLLLTRFRSNPARVISIFSLVLPSLPFEYFLIQFKILIQIEWRIGIIRNEVILTS